MIVGCKLPHGHTIEFNGETIALNGANVGFDGDNPWKMDAFPDSPLRTSGVGLTTLEGKQADAFKAWYDAHKTGGPIASGAITESDIRADFYDIKAGLYRRDSADQITIAKNGGGAHLDLMTSAYVLAMWRQR